MKTYLKAPNAGQSDKFGHSASISGDTIVIGAIGETNKQTTITNGTFIKFNNLAKTILICNLCVQTSRFDLDKCKLFKST